MCVCVYSPHMGKSKEETDTFYENPENKLRNIQTTEKLVIIGDLNSRIRNNILSVIKRNFYEEQINENGYT